MQSLAHESCKPCRLEKEREDLDAARVDAQLAMFGTATWGAVAVLLSSVNAARVPSLGSVYPAALAVASMFLVMNGNNLINNALKCVILVRDIGRISDSDVSN